MKIDYEIKRLEAQLAKLRTTLDEEIKRGHPVDNIYGEIFRLEKNLEQLYKKQEYENESSSSESMFAAEEILLGNGGVSIRGAGTVNKITTQRRRTYQELKCNTKNVTPTLKK